MKIEKSIIPTDYQDQFWCSNFNDLRAAILYELGWPTIKIEITDLQLNRCIHAAIIQFLNYDDLGLHVEHVAIQEGGWCDIPKQINKDLIRDVLFQMYGSSSYNFGGDLGLFFTSPAAGENLSIPNYSMLDFDVTNYYMIKQNLESVRSILSIDRYWEILNDRIKLYPTNIVSRYTQAAIIYGKLLTPEEFETEEWIREYATAHAKVILGTVRRKFSNFSYAGGQGSTDGAELIQEGKEEMEKLKESKRLDSRPPPIFQF